MIVWSLVIRRMCTVEALKTTLTMDDVLDMTEACNLEDAINNLPVR